MGQRHQVYVAHADGVVGIHHQWLYGHTAARLLGRFITLVERADADWRHVDPQTALNGVYSCDPDEGYVHGVHTLEGGGELNPLNGDNNDGITIIDTRNDGIGYCFMKLAMTEFGGLDKATPLMPMSVREYVGHYYPSAFDIEAHLVESDREQEAGSAHPDNAEALIKLAARIHAVEKSSARVLTLDEVREIFPAMFPHKRVRKGA